MLSGLLRFYAEPGARVLDCTANRRRMWEGVQWGGQVLYMDLDPAMRPDFVGDFRQLPVGDGSFGVLVFDPPHLPSAAGTDRARAQFRRDFGLGRSIAGDNVSAYYGPFLAEARRVLVPDGLVFAKVSDYVHNHRYQWSIVDFVQAVRATPGLTACDLRIKRDPCGGNLKSGKWVNAHHARNVHSYWVVVRKGGCEARPTASGRSP